MNRKIMIGLMTLAVLSSAVSSFAYEVYATKNGKKFHKADCEFIKDRQTVKMDDSDAIKKGLKPCGACILKDQHDQLGKEKK